MRKIDLGQIIQILANLGVIAGIVFLAFELHQNNDLLTADARAMRAQVRIDYSNLLVNNPELVGILVKETNGDNLSQEEQYALEQLWDGMLTRWQYVYGEFQAELIDESDIPIDYWRDGFRDHASLRTFWEATGVRAFRPDFVAYVQQNVIDGP